MTKAEKTAKVRAYRRLERRDRRREIACFWTPPLGHHSEDAVRELRASSVDPVTLIARVELKPRWRHTPDGFRFVGWERRFLGFES